MLAQFRQEIDSLDEQLVTLLAQRFDVVRRVAEYKAATDTPMMQPDRVAQVRERWSAVALEHGCAPENVLPILDRLFERMFAYEDTLIEARRAGA